jgi:hypothetical protein
MYQNNSEKYSDKINAFIKKIKNLSSQKKITISEVSNLNVEMKKIESEILNNTNNKIVINLINLISKEFTDVCEEIVNNRLKNKNLKNKIFSLLKIKDNYINSENIKKDFEKKFDEMMNILKKDQFTIDKLLEEDKELSLDVEDLELFPTKDNPNPKHEELLYEIGAQKACYANYIGEYGDGSSFICGEDEKNIYMMTNRHVALKLKEDYSIFRINKIRNLEFESNSWVKFLRFNNIQYFPSSNIDMAILKIPKRDLKIQKELYIPEFSPDLINNNSLVISMGNVGGSGNVTAFGRVLNNKDIKKEKINNNIRKNNFIESKLNTYPGNSGGPLFTCDVIQNKYGDINFNNFRVVGLHARGSLKKELNYYQAKKIEGYTKYDQKFDDCKRVYINSKLDECIQSGKSKKEQHEYKEKLEYEIKKMKEKDPNALNKLIGFDEEGHVSLKYKFNENFAYSIPSIDLINEVKKMKDKNPELKNLNLKVSQSKNIEVWSILRQIFFRFRD